MATEYGTIAVVPKGEWDSSTEYEVANLVSFNGSSYIAHTQPPLGTLPTDSAYWQVSAQGTSKATVDSLGVVKPDGITLDVDSAGTISAKLATQSTAGIVKGSAGINVGVDGSLEVNTTFQQATALANIIAGEAIAQVLGKVSKSIAVTMGLEQNALLKNMLTNVDTDDTSKVPSAALLHSIQQNLQEQIVDRIPFSHLINNGLTTEEGFALDARYGKTLADGIAQLNSALGKYTSTGILSSTQNMPSNSTRVFHLTGSSYTGNDVPPGGYIYGSAIATKRDSGTAQVLLFGGTATDIPIFNLLTGAGWVGWKKFDGTLA